MGLLLFCKEITAAVFFFFAGGIIARLWKKVWPLCLTIIMGNRCSSESETKLSEAAQSRVILSFLI